MCDLIVCSFRISPWMPFLKIKLQRLLIIVTALKICFIVYKTLLFFCIAYTSPSHNKKFKTVTCKKCISSPNTHLTCMICAKTQPLEKFAKVSYYKKTKDIPIHWHVVTKKECWKGQMHEMYKEAWRRRCLGHWIRHREWRRIWLFVIVYFW